LRELGVMAKIRKFLNLSLLEKTTLNTVEDSIWLVFQMKKVVKFAISVQKTI